MMKNNTVNRLLWEGKVYYRAKDLAKQLFKCSMYKINKAIKNSDIEVVKLDGIGGKWIKEEDVQLIKIENESKMMKTSYKDLQEEIKTNISFASLFRQLHPNDPRPEGIVIQDAIDKAYNSVNNFNTTSNSKQKDEDTIKNLNEIFKKNGFAERIHKVKSVLNTKERDIEEFYVLIDQNGQVLDVFNYLYSTDKNLIESAEKGYFDNYDYDEDKIVLTKGIPFKIDEEDIINNLIELAKKSDTTISKCDADNIDITLKNEKCIMLDAKFLSCLLFNKVTIIKNDIEELLKEIKQEQVENHQQICEDLIIDVDYTEVVEEEIQIDTSEDVDVYFDNNIIIETTVDGKERIVEYTESNTVKVTIENEYIGELDLQIWEEMKSNLCKNDTKMAINDDFFNDFCIEEKEEDKSVNFIDVDKMNKWEEMLENYVPEESKNDISMFLD